MDTDSEKEPTPAPVKKPAVRATIGGKKKAPAATASNDTKPKAVASSSKAAQPSSRRSSSPATARDDSQQDASHNRTKRDALPPVRSLPFQKTTPQAKAAAKAGLVDSGSETEEDDEL
jgi:hypothetical protein